VAVEEFQRWPLTFARIAALPTRDEMLARLHGRSRVNLKTPAARIIRRERESA
jgi:hypothetical protein